MLDPSIRIKDPFPYGLKLCIESERPNDNLVGSSSSTSEGETHIRLRDGVGTTPPPGTDNNRYEQCGGMLEKRSVSA